MSRFGNLEFGSEHEEPAREQFLARDENYLLSQAQQSFEAGRFEQALRAYAKVLEVNPKQPVAWVGQVRAQIELGEFSEARVWADKAL
jgi:Flp pilus assembly protein TadD